MISLCAHLTGQKAKAAFVFCPCITQWILLLIAPPPLAPPPRASACGATKPCETGGGFGSACMCCHRHPLSSPDHLRNSMFLITLCFWAGSSACRHLHHDRDESTQRESGVHAIGNKPWFFYHLIKQSKSDVKSSEELTISYQLFFSEKELPGPSSCGGLNHHSTRIIIFRLLMVKMIDGL